MRLNQSLARCLSLEIASVFFSLSPLSLYHAVVFELLRILCFLQVMEPLDSELSDSTILNLASLKQPKSKGIILNLKPNRTNNKA